jgi:hypothetical protein
MSLLNDLVDNYLQKDLKQVLTTVGNLISCLNLVGFFGRVLNTM